MAFALVYALKLIGQALSFSADAYGLGCLVVLVLTTLTDRTDFYAAGRQTDG